MSQQHRGPDANGLWIAKDRLVGLAHTRLAILDLSQTGNQPMSSADERLVIVFNGEIYNWQKLRDELILIGISFRTQTDTEVLLEAYRVWKVNMLDRLLGMFAFAIYDQDEDLLFCARDPIGKKPLLYANSNDGILIASEIPAIKAAQRAGFNYDNSYDYAAIASLFVHNIRHIPEPATAYKGIRRLRPGHAFIVREGCIDRIWRYWVPHKPISVPTSCHEAAELVYDQLDRAVTSRLQADVPIGALLSGGVDSTAIVALAQKRSRSQLRTYALGSGPDDEDLKRARMAAQALNTDHHEFYFDVESAWSYYERVIVAYGEPIALLPLVHALVLCEAVRDDGIKVVLAGHGADELFYGYTGHFRTALLSAWASRLRWFISLIRNLPSSLIPRQLAILAAQPGTRKAALYRNRAKMAWQHVLSDESSLWLKCLAADEMEYWGKTLTAQEYIDESNFVALLVENAHSVAISTDLPAMQASVEMRAPFLDRDMIALALSIPWHCKLQDAYGRPRLKNVLKEAVKHLIPPALVDAPKRGFGYDIQEGRLFSGPWRDRVNQIMNDLDDLNGFLDKAKVLRLWDAFLAGQRQYAATIAKLMALQLWQRAA